MNKHIKSEETLKASTKYFKSSCYAYVALFYDTPWRCITSDVFCPCKIGKSLEFRAIESRLI